MECSAQYERRCGAVAFRLGSAKSVPSSALLAHAEDGTRRLHLQAHRRSPAKETVEA
jgi:hypothetical protein